MWPPLHYNIRSIAENGGTEIAARGDAVAQMPIGSESSLEVKAPIQLRASGQPDHSLRMVHVLQSGKYLTFPLCISLYHKGISFKIYKVHFQTLCKQLIARS